MPFAPGGVDPDVAPNPNVDSHELIADGDGYLELDEDGIPLGRWVYDPEEEMWMYDEFPPLGYNLPKAGEPDNYSHLFALLGVCLIGLGLSLKFRQDKLKKQIE